MGVYNPPVKAAAFKIGGTLQDINDNGSFKSNPTIASGDFKISKDFGAFANLTNIPTVSPAAGVQIEFSLTATEMTADVVTIVGIDTAPKEWADFALSIPTA